MNKHLHITLSVALNIPKSIQCRSLAVFMAKCMIKQAYKYVKHVKSKVIAKAMYYTRVFHYQTDKLARAYRDDLKRSNNEVLKTP